MRIICYLVLSLLYCRCVVADEIPTKDVLIDVLDDVLYGEEYDQLMRGLIAAMQLSRREAIAECRFEFSVESFRLIDREHYDRYKDLYQQVAIVCHPKLRFFQNRLSRLGYVATESKEKRCSFIISWPGSLPEQMIRQMGHVDHIIMREGNIYVYEKRAADSLDVSWQD